MRLNRGRIVACGVGVVAAAFWLGQGPDHGVGVTEPASDVPTLPDGFDRELASSGITYTVVGDPTEQQVRDARESVLGGFSAFLEEGETTVVMRVRFTDKSYGHVDDPEARNPVLSPYFTDRDALMVVLPNQEMPISHPAPDATGTAPDSVNADDFPESVKGTFVAFVDLRNNKVLRAVSWG